VADAPGDGGEEGLEFGVLVLFAAVAAMAVDDEEGFGLVAFGCFGEGEGFGTFEGVDEGGVKGCADGGFQIHQFQAAREAQARTAGWGS
jgi:hypothetical protein